MVYFSPRHETTVATFLNVDGAWCPYLIQCVMFGSSESGEWPGAVN